MDKNYKSTLNLPRTDFQMKAALPVREPQILEEWERNRLYDSIKEAGKRREKYILHDGPPYANGNIHIGHALNKILKDFIVKSRFMMGYATDYVPGWDCHGLPIELRVEREFADKKNLPEKLDIRKRCRAYAERFVAIQKEEFKRLGVFGEWEMPYLTMNFGYQASILRELGRCVKRGVVYRGKKPVHWCPSCRTALAEAEVEYDIKESPSVYVKFRIDDPALAKRLPHLEGKKIYILIWTTTPWTLPANLAIAVHPDFEYAALETKDDRETAIFVVAGGLVDEIKEKFKWGKATVLCRFNAKKLIGIKARHPFIERESVVIAGEHVTLEAGTGCVHIAPGHGQDDYELGLRNGLDIYAPVDNQGRFTGDVKGFEGQFVFDANRGIIDMLEERDALAGAEHIKHSYPHCWRCKRPVIFRATEQWFISMEKGNLRKNTLSQIDKVRWIPHWGRDRIYSMVENRPDWCISRQRAWGVPITAIICTRCGNSIINEDMVNRVADEVERHGADVWFEREVDAFIPVDMVCGRCGSSGNFIREEDILDVWFDSGSSFAAVLEKRSNLSCPADLYLEGSDQHRGWFQSSLLISVATRDNTPFKAVLTHGFVVDGDGKKMSKSMGNVISPQEIIDRYGAEVLRLWVAAEDYREDVRISTEILTRLSEGYRRIRNTSRFLLGNLYDFNPSLNMVDYEELPELDRFTLHRLAGLTERVVTAYREFEFHVVYHSIYNFCAVHLSAFYLDVLKDRLYTSAADSMDRRAAQTTVYHILDHMTRLLAPILPFTMEDVWRYMPKASDANLESVHLSLLPEVEKKWLDNKLEKRWELLIKIKVEASRALENARREKIIGHSLDARVTIAAGEDMKGLLDENSENLREILIVSQLKVVGALKHTARAMEGVTVLESEEFPELKVAVERASGKKCERCWNISEKVGANPEHPTICERCWNVLED